MAEDLRSPLNDQAGIPSPELHPEASAVDQYYHTDAGKQAQQLAGALQDFSGGVAGLADYAEQHAALKGTSDAEAAAAKDQSVQDYNTAVKKGLLPSSANPWFKQAARAQFGRVAAENYAQAFRNDPNTIMALSNSTSVKDFDRVEQAFRQKWQSDNLNESHNDLAFNSQFNHLTQAYIKDERNAFVGQANSRLLQQTTETHTQEIAGIVRSGREAGHTDAQITQEINDSNAAMIANGMNPRLVNVAASQAIANAAHDALDPTIFDLAKNVKAGSGSLYDTAYMGEDRQKISGEIITLKAREDTQAREDAAAQRADRVRTVQSQVIDQALDEKTKPQDIQVAIRQMAQDDPSKAIELNQLVHTLQTGLHDESNPQAVAHLTLNVWGGANPGDPEYVDESRLATARNAGAISTEDFTKLREQVQQRDKEAKEGGKNGVLNDSIYKWGLQKVNDVLASSFEYNADRNARAERAQAEYINNYLAFRKQKPDATSDDVTKFAAAQVDSLRMKYQSTRDQGKVGKLPDVNLTGQAADWKANRIMPLQNVTRIDSELKKGKLSPSSIQDLRSAGVPTDSVAAFVQSQKTLYQQP
jgi:hypothetical protein